LGGKRVKIKFSPLFERGGLQYCEAYLNGERVPGWRGTIPTGVDGGEAILRLRKQLCCSRLIHDVVGPTVKKAVAVEVVAATAERPASGPVKHYCKWPREVKAPAKKVPAKKVPAPRPRGKKISHKKGDLIVGDFM